MPWFRVDDTFAFHPKIIGLSPSAGWLWTRAGAWCAQLLTDGTVPNKVISALGGTRDDAAELVEAGLWTEVACGWEFHDWHDYQPTKEAVEAERAAARERQRKARAAAKAARDAERDSEGSNGVTSPDVTRDIRRESRSPRPIPARPSPSEVLFENFWSAYPRKAAKGDARKAWNAALNRAEAETIIEGAKRYAKHPDVSREGGKYVKYPATWLRADGWEDEDNPPQAAAPTPFSLWDYRPGASA